MTYDPALPTTRDRIRLIVGDISDDAETELLPDETYDARISEYSSNWKLAAAAIAESIAVLIEQKPTSFSAVGDMAIGWQGRTSSLRDIARRLRQEAAEEDAAAGKGITSVQLYRDGVGVSSEYRASQYRQLRR